MKRFPETTRLHIGTSEFQSEIKIGPRTYVVVMNHHLEKDQQTLKFALHSDAPYIGVLGPLSRRVRMLEALQDEGIMFDPSSLNRMHSPVGLDIGAISPEEIAISILAEIIAVKNGHTGGFFEWISQNSSCKIVKRLPTPKVSSILAAFLKHSNLINGYFHQQT